MKIYTKTGDQGETGLFGGARVSKTSSYIEAYGSVDELNSWLGSAAAIAEDRKLKAQLIQVQHDLHSLSADLATPYDQQAERFDEARTLRLEKWIDEYQGSLEPLKNFILPGGTDLASRLHIARTVCRRAERDVVAHASQKESNGEVIIYLNRLSDGLFVFARFANTIDGSGDVLWDQER